jgi:hypothetical protein
MTVPANERAQRIGRRLGNIVFALLIGSFTIVCSVQILFQGFSSSNGEVVTDCRDGLKGLVQSLHRAREATNLAPPSERSRIERFRAALLPEWNGRDELKRLCASSPWGKKAYYQVERLRWAEEHAVRYESADLAPSRQHVLSIEQALAQELQPSP